MTDDQTTPDPTTPAPTSPEEATVVTDGAFTLFVADFSDTDTAWEAYEALKAVEDGRTVEIDGVIVVKRDADGTLEVQKATDHSTRHGLTWGLVGGVVMGVAREVHHRKELSEELQDGIAPGHSGILALVSDPGAVAIRRALAKADAIVEKAIDKAAANEIKAVADEA
jgi:uncharacterized membrane protein